MRQGMTIARRCAGGLLVTLAAASVTVVALPSSASAHTDLARTVPAAGSVAKGPVSAVSLQFATPILPDLAAVVVTGGSGVRVDEPVVEGSTVEATVDGVARPGAYTVSFRAVAADGHPITGSFSFEVAPRQDTVASTRPRRDVGGVAATDRRRGAEAREATDAARGPGAEAAAEPPKPESSLSRDGVTRTASPTEVEPSRLGFFGIVGAGAAAVAMGASILRRRSLT